MGGSTLGPAQLRGMASGWLRYAGREASRRRAAASHAYALAARRAAIASARRAAVGWSAVTGVAVVGVPLSSGWTEVGCAVLAALGGVKAGRSSMRARRSARAPLPAAPALPAALPPPPPLGSRAWPALSRIEAATTTTCRLAKHDVRGALGTAVSAARGLDDAARLHAARIAAVETALRASQVAGETGRGALCDSLSGQLAALLSDLDAAGRTAEQLLRAALGVEAEGAAGEPAHGSHHAAGVLDEAIQEATARAYGLQVAAQTAAP